MSEYTPTTDEVETAFHEFASDLESKHPGTYEHAPEFKDWKEAMYGFRRWLAAHDRAIKAEAWQEGHAATLTYVGIQFMPIFNPYRSTP